MTDKPWNNVDIKNRSWFYSSNHGIFDINKCYPDNIDAFIIVQDCNSMGMEYLRIISWINNKTYFDIESKTDEMFGVSMKNIKLNDVLTYKKTTKKYKVIHSERFYKVLEKET
jgi:hypothetical protein